MTREAAVATAERLGWKSRGALRRHDHSSYQCFRRGQDYLWIGLRFVERSDEPVALDFVADPGVEEFMR